MTITQFMNSILFRYKLIYFLLNTVDGQDPRQNIGYLDPYFSIKRPKNIKKMSISCIFRPYLDD